MRKIERSPADAGFTLIELLAVITIMLILAAMVLGIGNLAVNKSRQSKAEADLAKYRAAAAEYHRQHGHYAGLSTGSGECAGLPGMDPWGSGYGCATFNVSATVTNNAERQQYIFFSYGPDRKPGKKNVNDDGDGQTDEERDVSGNTLDLSEVGYGDDIVVGNSARKKGFPPP
jgi:prepilin-type N-terminal cleavage/methylation domain-containing protein